MAMLMEETFHRVRTLLWSSRSTIRKGRGRKGAFRLRKGLWREWLLETKAFPSWGPRAVACWKGYNK